MSTESVLRKAEFTPTVIAYYLWSTALVLTLMVVTFPFAVLWVVGGRWYLHRWLDRLSCELTEKRLEVKKGILFRRESTIPLDKITDMQYFQGPLMRALGIDGLKVETAGQGSGPGQSLVQLVGIKDARGFRDSVIQQRDRLAGGAQALAPTATPALAAPETGDVLVQIRDALLRIEDKVGDSEKS